MATEGDDSVGGLAGGGGDSKVAKTTPMRRWRNACKTPSKNTGRLSARSIREDQVLGWMRSHGDSPSRRGAKGRKNRRRRGRGSREGTPIGGRFH